MSITKLISVGYFIGLLNIVSIQCISQTEFRQKLWLNELDTILTINDSANIKFEQNGYDIHMIISVSPKNITINYKRTKNHFSEEGFFICYKPIRTDTITMTNPNPPYDQYFCIDKIYIPIKYGKWILCKGEECYSIKYKKALLVWD